EFRRVLFRSRGHGVGHERRLDCVPHAFARKEEVVVVQNSATISSQAEVSVHHLAVSYGNKTVLSGVNLEIREREVFSIIGPANSGKTSFLRILNRMDEFTPNMHFEGEVKIGGKDVRGWRNLYALRRRIGVVFPLPVGLP